MCDRHALEKFSSEQSNEEEFETVPEMKVFNYRLIGEEDREFSHDLKKGKPLPYLVKLKGIRS